MDSLHYMSWLQLSCLTFHRCCHCQILPGTQLRDFLHEPALTVYSKCLSLTLNHCFPHLSLLANFFNLSLVGGVDKRLNLDVVLFKLLFNQVKVFVETGLEVQQRFVDLEFDFFL